MRDSYTRPGRRPIIEIAGREFIFQSRQLVQGVSGGVSVGAGAQVTIQQSEGPYTLFGAIRIKNFCFLISDSVGITATGCVTPVDGSLQVVLAQSSSGPYVTVASFPLWQVAQSSMGTTAGPAISTQGLVSAWYPHPGTADFTRQDWQPVQPNLAPLWELQVNLDVFNNDTGGHTVVCETSAIVENYVEMYR